MIRRRRQTVKQARPWLLDIRVRDTWLEPKRPLDFIDVEVGKRYADQAWRGVHVTLTHQKTREKWSRDWLGAWTHEKAPAPAPQPAADAPRYYWQDRD